jgi:hypothetical protein
MQKIASLSAFPFLLKYLVLAILLMGTKFLCLCLEGLKETLCNIAYWKFIIDLLHPFFAVVYLQGEM